MLVREIINIALRYIGVSTTGQENKGNDQFINNLRQLQLVVDSLRNIYPYKVSQTFTNSEIPDAKFVSIDAMFSSPNNSPQSINLPMQSITLEQYNALNINPNVKGWPQYYYFQLPYTIKIWPNDPAYTITVTGKINNALGLVANTELDPSPLFFQDLISQYYSKRMCPFYKKDWTIDHERELQSAITRANQNTDIDFTITNKPINNDNGRWRVKYLVSQ